MRAIALIGVCLTLGGSALAAEPAAQADVDAGTRAVGERLLAPEPAAPEPAAPKTSAPGALAHSATAALIGAWIGTNADGVQVALALGADGAVAGRTVEHDNTTLLLSGHYAVQAIDHVGARISGIMTWFDLTAYPKNHDDPANHTLTFTTKADELVLDDTSEPHNKPITLHRAARSPAQLGLVPPSRGWLMPPLDEADRTKAALRAFGLTGAWAHDCSRPLASHNPYTYYQVPADGPATMTVVLPLHQTQHRTVRAITEATIPAPGQLRLTTKLVSPGPVKDDHSSSLLYRDDAGLHVWSTHFAGIATSDFGHYKAGERIDQDGIFMGYLVLPNGKLGIPMPPRQRCGDQAPPPAQD